MKNVVVITFTVVGWLLSVNKCIIKGVDENKDLDFSSFSLHQNIKTRHVVLMGPGSTY